MAAALKTVGSYALGFFSFIPMPSLSSSTKVEEDPFKNELDPLSLIINLATASLLTVGIKPTQINHHIKWENPLKYGIKIAEVNAQFAPRVYQNTFGEGIAKKEVIELWEKTIEKASNWYEPHRVENKTLKFFFEKAIKGLNTVKETYKDKNINKDVDKCILALKNAINKKRILEKESLLNKIHEICKEVFKNRLDLYSVIISHDEANPEEKFELAWKAIVEEVDDWYDEKNYESENIQNFIGKAIQAIQNENKKSKNNIQIDNKKPEIVIEKEDKKPEDNNLKDNQKAEEVQVIQNGDKKSEVSPSIQKNKKSENKMILQTLNECFTKLSITDKMKRIWQRCDFDKIEYTIRECEVIIESDTKDPKDEKRVKDKIKVISAIVNDRCNEFGVLLNRSFRDL